jgi:hypothetical protein
MMKQCLTVPQWLELDRDMRTRFVEIFDIKKSGYTEVEDGRVVTDGHWGSDLMAITVEKMQEYTGLKDENFIDLINAVIIKIEKENDKQKSNKEASSTTTGSTGKDEGTVGGGTQASGGDKPKARKGKGRAVAVPPTKLS